MPFCRLAMRLTALASPLFEGPPGCGIGLRMVQPAVLPAAIETFEQLEPAADRLGDAEALLAETADVRSAKRKRRRGPDL